ncbi:MAG: hypothetical protein AB1564_00165 [Chloroflexota bacterium]
MREWTLGAGDPLFLTLAADARPGAVDYGNDHIWELEPGSGEPPAFSLRTTFGLRARSMRLFPRFGEGKHNLTDPAKFFAPPRLKRFHPNFLHFELIPFESLDVTAEYWVPQSQVAAGRYTLTNRSKAPRRVRFEICAMLVPLDGQAMAAAQLQMVNVLAGRTGNLAPVLFMTGGPLPGPGPFPSLMLEVNLGPGASHRITWAQAALSAPEASFDLARRTAARPWEAERTRIERTAESDFVDVHTGDPDWDAAFAFSQTAAASLFFPASSHLPNASFVSARQPDHGFSHKGDGSDHPLAWSGQSPLDAYYLTSLLPGAPHLTRGLLDNFLSTQTENGFIDNRPGLAGQRGKMLAAPLLAGLARHADDFKLAEVFPKLLSFFWAWFSPEHDRDRNGLPEWDHLLQTGFEDNPLFDVWNPWSQGADIAAVDNPGLFAMLYREAQSLLEMAARLGRADEMTLVREQADLLCRAVEAGWNARRGLYQYHDLLTGFSLPGEVLANGKGNRALKPKLTFEQPVRLLIEIQTQNPAATRPEIHFAEFATKEAVETISAEQFRWRSGGLTATSARVYERLGRVEARGLSPKDKVIVRLVDLTGEDHTLFLPLWAGIPDPQRAQAMIGRSLLDAGRFDRPFGIPACASCPDPAADPVCLGVSLPWNHLIGEGLLAYGFRAEAARLVAHQMTGVIQNLKKNRAFYQRYHAETGAGLGERNSLQGLAPLGLFLETLGVTILSATKVKLEGKNPFPWPVTIRYRGLTVKRGSDSTEVIFANGKSVTVTDAKPCIVSI